MSIDFTGVTGIEDDYGNVTKITDAAGNVLWKSGPDMAIVRLMADTFEDRNYCSAYINYMTPEGDTGSLSTTGEYELPIGTIINCTLEFVGKDRANIDIYLNGDNVASATEGMISYQYTLTQNIAIKPINNYYNGGYMYVAEVPENDAVFFVGYDGEIYGAENGMTWEEWCNSDCYNANSNVTISGNAVLLWGSTLYYDGNAVKPTDAIIDGASYYN